MKKWLLVLLAIPAFLLTRLPGSAGIICAVAPVFLTFLIIGIAGALSGASDEATPQIDRDIGTALLGILFWAAGILLGVFTNPALLPS